MSLARMGNEPGHRLCLQAPNLDSEMVQAYNRAKTMGIKIDAAANANTNNQEFISECWAEARNSPAPRQFAQKIADIARSRYAAKHP